MPRHRSLSPPRARPLPPAGRRSLLLHRPRAADARLVLASVAPLDPGVPFEGFEELPPGLYSLQLPGALPATAAADGAAATAAAGGLSSGGSKLGISIARHEWADEGVRRLAAFWRAPELVQPPAPDAADAGSAAAAAAAVAPPPDPAFEATVDAVLSALRQAVATRCRCIDERPPCTAAVAAAAGAPGSPRSAPVPLLPPAPVLVLFSGGVDSTLLAALAHEALPEGAPIDLACVCFDAGASPDRQSALDALRELRAFAPSRLWRLLQVGRVDVEVRAAGVARTAGAVQRCWGGSSPRGLPPPPSQPIAMGSASLHSVCTLCAGGLQPG